MYHINWIIMGHCVNVWPNKPCDPSKIVTHLTIIVCSDCINVRMSNIGLYMNKFMTIWRHHLVRNQDFAWRLQYVALAALVRTKDPRPQLTYGTCGIRANPVNLIGEGNALINPHRYRVITQRKAHTQCILSVHAWMRIRLQEIEIGYLH